MNFFDSSILSFLNGFAHRSWPLDFFAVWLTADGFQKGGFVMMLVCWAWFRTDGKPDDRRQILLCTLCAVPVAFLVSRLIGSFAPFRIRPIFNPALHLHVAYDFSPEPLFHWNAFPSDHAALFFTLVAGLFWVSHRLGWLALAYVLLFVCLPRVYLGLHHPTDILAGAIVGVGIAYLACLGRVREALAGPGLRWLARHPASFYACGFVYTWQVAGAFGWVRNVIEMCLRLFGGELRSG